MPSIDLKDAYYTVPISTDHQKYLKFIFNGSIYQYTCLPNGLSCAQRVFTKLLKPVYATLHNLGYLSLGYIDDSYLQGDTSSEWLENVNCTASLFKKLGFYLHATKSIVIPTQQLIFVGFVLNSIAMTVTPSEGKIQKLVTACRSSLNNSNPTIQEVCQVIGLIVSNFPGAEYGPLHHRSLESDKTQALELNKGDYKSHMQLTNASIAELEWWIENMPTVRRNTVRPNPSIVVQTDAPTKGWGAALGNDETGGLWTSSEGTNHINILELNIDLFASRLNNQLDAYCSWKPDPGCTYVDAFSINWSNFNFFAFPPFSLIPKCVQKIIQDKAKGILLIPVWPTQTWFPLVLQLLYSQPWIFKPSPNLLRHAHFKEPHPLHKTLHLMVCPLSGTPLHSKTFLQTLPTSSWPHGLMADRN